MALAKVTSKGQITLPIKVRQKLGLKTGSHVSFEPFEDDFIIKALSVDPLDELEGFVEYKGTAHTVEEMNAAIQERAATLFKESIC